MATHRNRERGNFFIHKLPLFLGPMGKAVRTLPVRRSKRLARKRHIVVNTKRHNKPEMRKSKAARKPAHKALTKAKNRTLPFRRSERLARKRHIVVNTKRHNKPEMRESKPERKPVQKALTKAKPSYPKAAKKTRYPCFDYPLLTKKQIEKRLPDYNTFFFGPLKNTHTKKKK